MVNQNAVIAPSGESLGAEESPSKHPEYKAWKQHNQKAITIIGLGLADPLIHHVDCTSNMDHSRRSL